MGNRFFKTSLSVIFFVAHITYATEYHVAVTGNDNNTGTSSSPFKTIKKGVSKLATSDTLTIHEGTYIENDIAIDNASGTPSKMLLIRGARGETVIIDGKAPSESSINTMHITGYANRTNNIIIRNLNLTGGGGDESGSLKIGTKGNCDNIVVEKCNMWCDDYGKSGSNPSVVVFYAATNSTIRNCKVWGDGSLNNGRNGIKLWSGAKRMIVENNVVYGLGGKGIDNKHGGRTNFMQIRYNFVYDCGNSGIVLNSDSSIVEHNVVVKTKDCGISIWEEAGGPGGSHSLITHNTIYNCDYGINAGQTSTSSLVKCKFTYNLITHCNKTLTQMCISPYLKTSYVHGHQLDSNLYYSDKPDGLVVREFDDRSYTLVNWKAKSNQDLHSIQAKPIFTDSSKTLTAPGDFLLTPQSPGYKYVNKTEDVGANISKVGINSSLWFEYVQVGNNTPVLKDTVTIKWSVRDEEPVTACQVLVSINGGSLIKLNTDGKAISSYKYTIPDSAQTLQFVVRGFDVNDIAHDYTTKQFTVASLKKNIRLYGYSLTGSKVYLTGKYLRDSSISNISILYNTTKYPSKVTELESSKLSFSQIADTSIDNLNPNTTYYFSLFYKVKNGEWSDCRDSLTIRTSSKETNPQTEIIDTIAIPRYFSESPTYSLTCFPGNQQNNRISGNIDTLKGTSSRMFLRYRIPASVVLDSCGFGAQLILKTSAYLDTINIGKYVLRDVNKIDNFTSQVNTWQPISVTAMSPINDLASHLKYAAKPTESWVYDKTKLRLLQWAPSNLVGVKSQYYEYGTISNDLFSLLPTRLFWFKANQEITFNFDKGYCLPLLNTTRIVLNPKGWTDFSIPFHHAVSLASIISSTNTNSLENVFDSLELYEWKVTDKSYVAEPVYLPGITPSIHSVNLVGGKGTGYTVYNTSSKPIQITIPGINMIFPLQKASTQADGYVNVVSNKRSGEKVASIFVVNSANRSLSRRFAIPPSLGQSHMYMYDTISKTYYGHLLTDLSTRVNSQFKVAFVNDASTPDTQLVTFTSNQLLYGKVSFIHDGKLITDISKPVTVILKPLETKVSTLSVNFSGLISSKVPAQPGIYNLQFDSAKHGLKFQVSVPSQIKRARVQVFNGVGKLILNKELRSFGSMQTIILNTKKQKLGAGKYMIYLQVYDNNNKRTVYVASQASLK